MREISTKRRQGEAFRRCLRRVRGEEIVITRHGRREAVVISWATWRRLSNVPSFGRLLAAAPLDDADLPAREETPLRDAGL